MASGLRGNLLYIVSAVLLGGLLAVTLWPQPLTVDLAPLRVAPMQVTIDGEGKIRVREAYRVSAPVAGQLHRITLHAGDTVRAGDTVLARIAPNAPAFLNNRSRRALEATIKTAEAARLLAKADWNRALAEKDFTDSEMHRAAQLAARGTISKSALEKAERESRTKAAFVASAEAAYRMRVFEMESARAALIEPGTKGSASPACCVTVRAPINATVLRVFHEDAGVITSGTELMEIGDPKNQEILVDLLSEDAVRIRPGMAAVIDEWGGDGTLSGTVRRVEPYGYTKVSALGVEEQRVNVLIDLTAPSEASARLGHGFRIKAHIVTWSRDTVLQVPVGALFRDGDAWVVYREQAGRAVRTPIEIGQRNTDAAQILGGLTRHDRVVLHPGNRLQDGIRIIDRN